MYILKTLFNNRFHIRSLITGMACMAIVPTSSFAAEIDVVLLLGQSNMDGRASVDQLDADADIQNDAIIWYTNPSFGSSSNVGCSTQSWVDLEPGFSVPPRTSASFDCKSNAFGPEIGFATFHDDNSDRQLAIIKFSEGGTNLRSDWAPDNANQLYAQSLTTYYDAMAGLQALGHTGILKAILWHQGESDAGFARRGGDYEELLYNLIASYRLDLGNANLPFIIGEVFDDGRRTEILDAQNTVADDLRKVTIAPNNWLDTIDGTHYDADSQLSLGRRFARDYIRIAE